MLKLTRLPLLLLMFTPSFAFAVIEDCSHGVSFNHGGTTKGLTAQVNCTQRGKPQFKTRQVGFKNGKLHGKTTRYDGFLSGSRSPKNKVIVIENYLDGKKHGKFMYYDKTGAKLEKESRYKNGIELRTVHYKDRGGKTIKFSRKHELGNFAQSLGSVSYNKANQLTDKSCPDKASGVKELDSVCGFGANKKVVNLHNAQGKVVSTSTVSNGKNQERKSFYPSGKVRVISTANKSKTFYESGKLMKEVVDSANRTQMVTQYYENGSKKSYDHTVDRKLKASRTWYENGKTDVYVTRQGNSERMAVKSYYDTGRVYADYVYTTKNKYAMYSKSFYRTAELVGNSRMYYKNGRMFEDVRRDAKGEMQSAKIYYDTGKLKKVVIRHKDKTYTLKKYKKDGSLKTPDSGIYYSDGSIKQALTK